jgi:cytoskeletal protein RodZ
MFPKKKEKTKAALLAATSALVLLLAGCQSAATTPPDSYTGSTTPIQNEKEDEPNSPQKTYIEQADNDFQKDEPHSNFVDTTSDKSAKTSTAGKKDDTKATVKTASQDAVWSADAPKLNGITIGNSDAIVSKLFGKPVDSYQLDDENEAIKVLEYKGFAIGINVNKKVQYIEVYDKSISAGLSGLHIGDDPETALKAIGKPDKQTTYLLTYKAKGALLKLDLDPVHNEIVSIKLLALDE